MTLLNAMSVRSLIILYGLLFTLTLDQVDSSSIDPLVFLQETDCIYSETQDEKDIENPLCSKYRISTLNSSPHRCLHIASRNNRDDNSTVICTDYSDWTDGTNGCSGYNREKDWCELYGHITGTEGLGAKQACCVCGGGRDRHEARYQLGDLVRVPPFSEDCVLKVIGIQEDVLSTYTLETVDTCYQKVSGKGYMKTIRAKKKVKVDTDDRNPEHMYPNIELRRCRPGTKEQEFWVFPQKDKDDSLNQRNFIIQHVITGTILKREKSNAISLQQVFEKENEDGERSEDRDKDKTFSGSEQFVHIVHGANNKLCLISGQFGKSDLSSVMWTSMDSTVESPDTMWSFDRVEESDNNHVGQHSKWLQEKVVNGHLSYLKQLAPWHLLDIERDAPKNEVKARFRMLSKDFHPDKRGGALFEQIFMLLQEAYDGLTKADETEKERYRINAEVESQLFPHSEYVVELLPSDWKLVGNGTRAKYVLSTNLTNLDAMTGETSQNATEINVETDFDSSQVWLLFLYSPRCGMSRHVVSLLELAAKHLYGENIRVGAYGCGLYGQSLDRSKTEGFIAWTVDPVCKQFQRKETPNSHIVVEAISGSQDYLERSAKFAIFYSAAAKGTTRHMWPRRFIDFAMKGKRNWHDRSLVKYLTRDDFESPSFHNETRLIVFVNDIEDNVEAHEVQDAILAAVPHVAHKLMNASIHVSIASCGMEAEDDASLIDCSAKSVSWLPDIKIYGVNQTQGRSLISEEFLESRDAQIALETLTNTLAVLFGLDDDEDSLIDDEEEVPDDSGGGGGCQAPPPMFEKDEDLLKLNQDEKPELDHEPENPKIEGKAETPKIEGKAETPKIEGETVRPKLAEPVKPKLAQRQKTTHVLLNQKRKSAGRVGGGAILGGGGSHGSVGAISG